MVELLDTNIDKKITGLIDGAKHIAIIPSKVAGPDAFSAGVGLYHMLTAKEKKVSFIYPGKCPDICEDLIAKEDVVSNITERELLVLIDYAGTPAAKVHYSTENDVLILKVGPISRDFDIDNRVRATVSGFNFDLIITIGVLDAEDLGSTYRELEQEIRSAKIINIDNTEQNTKYGDAALIDPSSESLSLVIYKNAYEWGLVPTTKAAKALLTGMTYREKRVDHK